ncbi:ethanolamine ammonia-lyase subunit EutC [Caldimonas tepidiphila]|uniref:ethanolamine ammonia-lyase subunit EutC n=1 Tax=Caldimonas tepidiphila TaxID=2315841 RepID=UPI000E5B6BEA|nr:ethanolamine ammonia-lyase subunit EutC [Caldimonas tepidiphila]
MKPRGEEGALPAGPSAEPAPEAVTPDPWQALRRHTPARIALGRAGTSLPTAAQLALQLAHARARDAVHRALDAAALAARTEAGGRPAVRLHSAAADRPTYLQRPDLGRRLDAASRERLQALRAAAPQPPRVDLAFALVDGLSALAVERHALPLLEATLARLRADPAPWTLAPMAVVEQGRVAVGDEIGEALGADLVVVLIGERPGLSSPDSLGAYLTWAPRPGRSDAERNCISNVRPEGLGCDEAALRLDFLLREARRRRLSGVALKDASGDALPDAPPPPALPDAG